MVKAITIADVAKHAEVSKSTVSQYLNQRYEYMSERTRKRIEESIVMLNYRPNIVARSLTQKSTFTVGIIVANILHSFSTQIIRAVERNFNQHGFHTIVCNADDEPEKERQYIEMLMAKQVDGIIIFPTGDNLDLYQQMKKQQYPLVFVDRTIDGLNIPAILLQNEHAAALAVDSLVENGFQRIAMMTTSITRHITPRVERIEGYKKALLRHQLPIREAYIHSVDVEHIKDRLHMMFELNEPPEALIAGNDRVLVEVLNYAKEHQISIPHDLALIGIDEVSFANIFTPRITTISQPAVEMANEAVALLLQQINNENHLIKKDVIRYKGHLNNRDSHIR